MTRVHQDEVHRALIGPVIERPRIAKQLLDAPIAVQRAASLSNFLSRLQERQICRRITVRLSGQVATKVQGEDLRIRIQRHVRSVHALKSANFKDPLGMQSPDNSKL